VNRFTVCVRCFSIAILLGLSQIGTPARADTLTGVFSSPVLAGNLVNYPTYGTTSFADNTGTAVIGTATPGGALCAGANTLCWGTAPDLSIPASEQYSQLTFVGSTAFNPNNPGIQSVGSITFLNGTSDLGSLIFGSNLSIYDNGNLVGVYNVIINTTSNQYSGTGLTPAQLAIDADYINICGNQSNICASSIEAFEAGEGGTGLTVDLTGNLVGDPQLFLDGVNLDPSESGCTSCGVVGSEPGLATTPEPSGLILMSTAAALFVGSWWRERRRGGTAVNL
jgi:hypothetical protein